MAEGGAGAPVAATPVQAPGQPAPGGVKPPVAPPAAAAPVPEADELEALLKTKPVKLRNKAGKEVVISNRREFEHFANKGFGAGEVIEKYNKLETDHRGLSELIKRIEAGDEDGVDILRKGLGPKWRSIVEKEALRDFEEEERLKGIPPHIRERLQEAERLKAEKADRDVADRRSQAQAQQAEQQRQLAEVHKEVERIGVPALQKLGFPANPPPQTIHRLAQYMAENIDLARERGTAELPIEMVAAALQEDMQSEYKVLAQKFIESKDFDGAVRWLGEDFVNFMRRGDLARLRGAANAPPPAAAPPPASEKKKDFWSY